MVFYCTISAFFSVTTVTIWEGLYLMNMHGLLIEVCMLNSSMLKRPCHAFHPFLHLTECLFHMNCVNGHFACGYHLVQGVCYEKSCMIICMYSQSYLMSFLILISVFFSVMLLITLVTFCATISVPVKITSA